MASKRGVGRCRLQLPRGVTLRRDSRRFDAHVWVKSASATRPGRRRGAQVFVGEWSDPRAAAAAVAIARYAVLGDPLPAALAAHAERARGLGVAAAVRYARAAADAGAALDLLPSLGAHAAKTAAAAGPDCVTVLEECGNVLRECGTVLEECCALSVDAVDSMCAAFYAGGGGGRGTCKGGG